MRLKNENELVYLGLQTRTSQNNNTYELVQLGDPVAYQNEQFFVNDELKKQLNGLSTGDKVQVVLDFETQGRNRSVSLVEIKKVIK